MGVEEPAWMLALADELTDLVRGANGGAWPFTRTQCERTARELELRLVFDGETGTGALGTVCLVAATGGDSAVLPRAVHEIAEAAAPRHLAAVAARRDGTLPHQLARMVERTYAAALVAYLAHEEEAGWRRREAQRAAEAPPGDLEYVPDEAEAGW